MTAPICPSCQAPSARLKGCTAANGLSYSIYECDGKHRFAHDGRYYLLFARGRRGGVRFTKEPGPDWVIGKPQCTTT